MNDAYRSSGGGGGMRSPDRPDREILREQWRVKAAEHIAAEDAYLREKKDAEIFYDRLVGELMATQPGIKIATAERAARTSDNYLARIEEMHNLRRKASDLKLEAADADRRYWECVSEDANQRAEMKMTGFAR